MGAKRAEIEHAQDRMAMAGTTKTNIMECMETSDYGVVRTGGWHVATPRSLLRRTTHKAGMVSGFEGTGNMASNRQQLDTTASTNIEKLRFYTQSTEGAEPLRGALTHVAIVTQRPRYVEVSAQTPIHVQHITQVAQLVPYVSSIGEAFNTLTIHVQHLVDDIGEFQTPRQWEVTK
jgi:hypothetical protein